MLLTNVTAAWHVNGCSARASLLVTNWHMIVCDLGEGVTYIYIYIYYIIIATIFCILRTSILARCDYLTPYRAINGSVDRETAWGIPVAVLECWW